MRLLHSWEVFCLPIHAKHFVTNRFPVWEKSGFGFFCAGGTKNSLHHLKFHFPSKIPFYYFFPDNNDSYLIIGKERITINEFMSPA
jgi:hypothetical protein